MTLNNIYVGGTLSLNNGRKAVAVYPALKGDKSSFMLTDQGRMVSVPGARINGVGVKRFLEDSGFTLATVASKEGAELADLLNIRAGTSLVEKAAANFAISIRKEAGGQARVFVPFDPDQPVSEVNIKPCDGTWSTLIDLASGFAAAQVEVDDILRPVSLAEGWLVSSKAEAATMPRCTEYGGLVERATYVVANSGLATLGKRKHLKSGATANGPAFPRGAIDLCLPSGDAVVVGINAGDELEVHYMRNDEVVYRRTGMTELRLGTVVGCIAAVVVRVSEMDAARTKPARRKAP